MRVLAINVGSSSVKCSFFGVSSPDQVTERWHAQAPATTPAALAEGLPRLLNPLWNASLSGKIGSARELDVVAHRIVHGGVAHRQTTWLTPEVRSGIAAQAEFAPSHNRLELAAIEAMDRLLGDRSARQIAVFDTAFHATMEPAAYVYPGPYEWIEQGIRRFGFHGISHAHAARRTAELLGRPIESLRMITCHLGNGCSLAAVRGGKSVDTTMGFTPADGLMMGTRCGSLDPGIPVFLLRHSGATPDDLDRVFNRESGLKGISGLSGDMREIQAAIAAGNARAKLAFDMYAHCLCRETGAMLAVLGGLDALVFTGGVGENCAPLRERVCGQFGFLGLRLDPNQNDGGKEIISTAESRVHVLVVKAEEEQQMARECCALMNQNPI